ncbi:hypothetical protein [Paraflavitalea speifideaquila]|uniref:hypothetical protein n=1 Tax=Paraflavitalea speifideaquila TaxID=3076558 RepID=UPI0028E8A0BC|nr:hypothetical protein [Paraflavitalea speifideiaquila]
MIRILWISLIIYTCNVWILLNCAGWNNGLQASKFFCTLNGESFHINNSPYVNHSHYWWYRIGREGGLKLLISKGHQVIVLTRGASAAGNSNYSKAHWDPDQQVIDVVAIQQADYIINLAGAGVADKRWSKRESRRLLIAG